MVVADAEAYIFLNGTYVPLGTGHSMSATNSGSATDTYEGQKFPKSKFNFELSVSCLIDTDEKQQDLFDAIHYLMFNTGDVVFIKGVHVYPYIGVRLTEKTISNEAAGIQTLELTLFAENELPVEFI